MTGREDLFGIDFTTWRKFDPALRQHIQRLSGDPAAQVPVLIALEGQVLEVNPAGQKKRFEQAAHALVQELRGQGAREIELYWINWTVGAVAPLAALGAIGKRGDVKQVLLVTRHRATC